MAINMNDRHIEEMRYYEERMRRAGSRSEHEYYRDRLRDLEMRMHPAYYYDDLKRVMPMPTQIGVDLAKAPEPVTPLSFLKSADKKLLLTGANQ